MGSGTFHLKGKLDLLLYEPILDKYYYKKPLMSAQEEYVARPMGNAIYVEFNKFSDSVSEFISMLTYLGYDTDNIKTHFNVYQSEVYHYFSLEKRYPIGYATRKDIENKSDIFIVSCRTFMEYNERLKAQEEKDNAI